MAKDGRTFSFTLTPEQAAELSSLASALRSTSNYPDRVPIRSAPPSATRTQAIWDRRIPFSMCPISTSRGSRCPASSFLLPLPGGVVMMGME